MIEICWIYFKYLNVKFYICGLICVIIKVILQNSG